MLFDLDNTITRFDTYRTFLLFVLFRRPGRWIAVLWLPLAVLLHYFGLRDNRWLKERFLQAILSGANRRQVDKWADRYISWLLTNGIRTAALQAVRLHKEAAHQLWLVTASFDFYVDRLCRRMGFAQAICTRSTWSAEDELQGAIDGKNCYGQVKVDRLADRFGTEREQLFFVVYTDHHSDLPLLQWADEPIVVNPTGRLRKEAESRGWEIQEW